MELEPLLLRAVYDNTQFMNALEQSRLGLTGLDRASDQATAGMSRSFTSASRTIGTSLGAASVSSTGFRFSLGQLTRQVGEFGTQVAAGRNPVEAFTRNLSQALVFMGPMGAAAGVAVVGLGALAQSFRDAGQDAEELKARAQEVEDALGVLGDIAKDGATDVGDLVTKIVQMSEAMQAVKTAQLAAGIDQIGSASEIVAEQLDDLIRALEQVGPDAASRIRSALQTGGLGAAVAQALREGVGEGMSPLLSSMQMGVALAEVLRQRFSEIEPLELVAPEQEAAVKRIAAEMQGAMSEGGDPQRMAALALEMSGVVEQAEELARGLDLDEPQQKALRALREMRDEMVELVRQTVRLNEEREAGVAALAILAKGARIVSTEEFGPEKPPKPPRASKPPPTFAEAVEPLERENALLAQIGVSREQIAQALRVERQIKRELSEGELEHLQAVLLTGAALEQRRALGVEAVGLLTEIEHQGRLTEEYRVQVALAKVRAQHGAEAAAAVEGEIREVEQLRSELGEMNAARDISDYIGQVELAVQFGGRETEEYRAQLQILELKQRLEGEISADLEAQVRHAQRLTSELRGAQAARSLREGIAGQRLEIEQAPNAAMMGMLHLPTSERGRVEQRMQALTQQLGSAEQAEGLRGLVEEAERFNTQLTLMNETAPAIADTLADIALTAAFEGPAEAAEQFAKQILELIVRIGLLQATMGAMSAFGGGFGAGAGAGAPVNQFATGTTGAGGAGFSLPIFGGPRQHGGRVDPRRSFLVGEAGPELFVPDTSGMIVPRSGGGGGGRDAQPQVIQPITNVSVTNTLAGAQVETKPPRIGADGSAVVDVLVSSSLDRLHSGGSLDRMLTGRRGTRRS